MNLDDITFIEEKAIQAAVKKDWSEAISLNKQILKRKPRHIPALNRLGIAYSKQKEYQKAKEIFKKALKINPQHPLVLKNINQLKQQQKNGSSPTPEIDRENFLHSFIEIPGIARNLPLIKPGEPKDVSLLEIGQPLQLKISARKIKVLTLNNHYIGSLPDNLSLRFIKLLKAGYKYTIHLKSNQPKKLQVFIHETKRSKRLKGIPTFVSKNDKSLSLEKLKEPKITPLEIYDPLAKED